ncbi:MAG: hypothetical protein ACRD3Q_03585 [Terriglobales bacterium]
MNWWRSDVRPAGRQSINAESPLIAVLQAQEILNFDQQTNSRWAKKLARRDEYREQIRRGLESRASP